MGYSLIELNSVTQAFKVKKILKRSSINAEVLRVGKLNGDRGCTYGIRFRANFLYDVIHILKNAGIDYSLVN